MKKFLLALTLLLGFATANAASVEDICGTYRVKSFTGWEYWWWQYSGWQEFSYSDYGVEITQVEGNTVALEGTIATFIGEYDAENSCIVFPYQRLWENYPYYFVKEIIGEDGNWFFDAEASVVAPIDENGDISFDGWSIVYDYGNGSYFWSFSDTKVCLTRPTTVDSICGAYNVDNFSGYECGFYTRSDWSAFEFNDYQVEISFVEGNQVALGNLLNNGQSIVGEFSGTENTIVFPSQVIELDGTSYIFTVEEWAYDSTVVYEPEATVEAYLDNDGTFNMNGWTLLYDNGDGNYLIYLIGVTSSFSPIVIDTSVKNLFNEETAINSNEPANYFNLSGMRVDSANLAPGIYIVKQGNATRKIIIRK